MKRKNIPTEFVYQLFALIIIVIVVQGYWMSVVRPNASEAIAEQNRLTAENPSYVPERSWWVLIKDYEQESCFMLMFWAFAIIGYKAFQLSRERRLLETDLIPIADGMRILPEDTREFARQIQALPEDQQRLLLPRVLLSALRRFASTHSIQDASTIAQSVCETEADRLESDLSMIRYIAWAIPAIGFIGTVRGIGDALAQANRAVQGDLSGVTESLGLAFNSTLIALLISIVLMFLIHQLQSMQERIVFDTDAYCDEKLIRHMKAD